MSYIFYYWLWSYPNKKPTKKCDKGKQNSRNTTENAKETRNLHKGVNQEKANEKVTKTKMHSQGPRSPSCPRH